MNFASDNNAAVHPEIMDAIIKCNEGYSPAYGYDSYTREADEICKNIFGKNDHVFPVFGGAPANILAMEPLLDRYAAVMCAASGHINTNEAGATERLLGNKIIPIADVKGKIDPGGIDAAMRTFEDEHQPLAQVLSLTQATEYGNCYTLTELNALGERARFYNLLIHIDGARFSNAAVSLGCSLKDIVDACGASSLSLGMLKNGGMFGESVVFFNEEHARNFVHRRKNLLQTQSKMRYSSAQFIALFANDLWERNARHSNAMAQLLGKEVSELGVVLTTPVETNGVFAILPEEIIGDLQKVAPFYVLNDQTHEVRLMCSWQTTEQDVVEFTAELKKLLTN